MSQKATWIVTALATVIALTSCGSGDEEIKPSDSQSIEATTAEGPTQEPSPTPTASEESATAKDDAIMGVPRFENLESCGRPCWLPIQPVPWLEDDETLEISLTTDYPYEEYGNQHGDEVQVVCYVIGEENKDENSQPSNQWYRIVISEDKVALGAGARIEYFQPAGDDSYYGYVSTLWLTIPENAEVPAC